MQILLSQKDQSLLKHFSFKPHRNARPEVYQTILAETQFIQLPCSTCTDFILTAVICLSYTSHYILHSLFIAPRLVVIDTFSSCNYLVVVDTFSSCNYYRVHSGLLLMSVRALVKIKNLMAELEWVPHMLFVLVNDEVVVWECGILHSLNIVRGMASIGVHRPVQCNTQCADHAGLIVYLAIAYTRSSSCLI